MTDGHLFTVFGGTGFLGSRLVRVLSGEGHRVRIAARHPERNRELLQLERVEPMRADLLDAPSVSAALMDAYGAVNATSLYLETSDLTFDAVHVEAAKYLARIAREAGTSRFVHVSGIGSDAGASDGYIRARGNGEKAVREALPTAAIVRSAVMFGPDDTLLNAILTTARRFPVYPLFGRGEALLQPVHVDDVAQAIARVLQAREAAPCYELAGPDIFSYRELVNTVAEAAGLRIRCMAVPFPLWRLIAFTAERLPRPLLTRSQVALLERDNVAAKDLPGIRDLGVSPRRIKDFVRHRELLHAARP